MSDAGRARGVAEQAEAYRAIGFGIGRRVGVGRRPAVVVIDMQRAFLEGAMATHGVEAAIAGTARLVAAARSAGAPVLYTRFVLERPDQAGLWSVKIPALAECLQGTEGAEIHRALAPAAGEAVVDKLRASGFFGTRLDRSLRDLDADSLLLGGVSTSGCVRATAVDAFQLDWPASVVTECVDDRSAPSHDAALLDIEAKYGDVVSLADAIAALTATSWAAAGRS